MIYMSALVQSFSMVAIAEIGDKTQLLSILLAARFQKIFPIIAGILIATLANHALIAYLGNHLNTWLNPQWVALGASLLFIGIGLWALVPDDAPELKPAGTQGAFMASLVAFFFAEMGDKTQLATLTLGAQYHDMTMVILGTTLGMLAANIPAVYLGEVVLQKVPLKAVRIIASLLFIGFGIYGLTQYYSPIS